MQHTDIERVSSNVGHVFMVWPNDTLVLHFRGIQNPSKIRFLLHTYDQSALFHSYVYHILRRKKLNMFPPYFTSPSVPKFRSLNRLAEISWSQKFLGCPSL